MAKQLQNLRNSMSQERREKIDAMTKDMLAEMPMYELRRARLLSQEQLADVLDIKQGSVYKLERRTDLFFRRCGVISKQFTVRNARCHPSPWCRRDSRFCTTLAP